MIFVRQMFQGKFAADVSFAGDPPFFATFQTGAFRADQMEAGAAAAPVESVKIDVSQLIRNKPLEIFKEAKQAEADYRAKWGVENPGGEFDPEDEAHNAFYEKHNLDWEDEDYQEVYSTEIIETNLIERESTR